MPFFFVKCAILRKLINIEYAATIAKKFIKIVCNLYWSILQIREAAKIVIFFSGLAIKRGGGVRAWPLKKELLLFCGFPKAPYIIFRQPTQIFDLYLFIAIRFKCSYLLMRYITTINCYIIDIKKIIVQYFNKK